MPRQINPVQITVAHVRNLRCPACRRNGAFGAFPAMQDAVFQVLNPGHMSVRIMGIRICPNPECGEPIFVDALNDKIIASFPAERLDFDPSDIPTKIVDSFEEALTGHANRCFKSAAIMVRRTLEEICADRGATGRDLKDRLKALHSVIVVPKELLDAADELRLLGNDAAHLEGKVYDDIGKEEVEAAIDLAKELLKAVYQLSSLVARLKSLKKPP